MEQYEFLKRVVQCLELLQIPYLVTGSVASIAYGEPRFTNDIDIVADIRQQQSEAFAKCFPEEEFYLDADSIREAILHRHQFNIIHPASGLKVDVIIYRGDAFDKSRFGRVKKIRPIEDTEVNFSAPEDVIIKKMEYYKEGGSEKHLRDITGILKVSGDMVDRDYISQWANQLGLIEIWEAIIRRLGERA